MPGIRVRVDDLSSVPSDLRLLRVGERRELRGLRLMGRRREEWIRGRVAIRRAVACWPARRASGGWVHAEPSGAPTVVGVDCAVSLSHDDPWFAVALAPSRALRIG